jgi:hypothetical protein
MKSNQSLKNRILFIVVLFVSITACNNTKSDKAEDKTGNTKVTLLKETVFDKLVGTWKSEDGNSFEEWSKNDNGTYRSRAYSVKGSDTLVSENANIYPENDKWVFENTVKNQNEGKAIKFTSSLLTDNSVQFSNPAHDFPTDINYTVPDANTVNAFIVGP